MTPIDRAREAAAKATEHLPMRDCIDPGGELDGLRRREAVRAALDAFLASLAEDGMVLVPREALLRHWAELIVAANRDDTAAQLDSPPWLVGRPAAKRALAAMIAAAQGDGT